MSIVNGFMVVEYINILVTFVGINVIPYYTFKKCQGLQDGPNGNCLVHYVDPVEFALETCEENKKEKSKARYGAEESTRYQSLPAKLPLRRFYHSWLVVWNIFCFSIYWE